MLKILLLGSEGFVGHNLSQGLSQSYQVFTADQVEHGSSANYTRFDITDFQSVNNLVKDVDVVINLVAHTLVSSLNDIIKNAQINIVGILNVLEACRKNNVNKIIFTSASSIIGDPQNFKVSEKDPIIPKTAYGITKMTSEHYLRLYNEIYGMNYVIFRFFNIYGPYQKNGIIPSIYSRIRENKPISVLGKGDQVRDYVYIKDVIPFFDRSISTNIANNSIFNLGTGKGTSIMQLINIFSKTLKIDPKIEYAPQRPGEIGNFVANTNHLISTFGFAPTTTIDAGLQNTIAWLNNN
jgi:UDP-glucose 4-epimerase